MLSVVLIAVLFGLASGQPTDLNALYLTTLNVTNKSPSWSLLTPACQWYGVGCDADGHVSIIVWQNMALGGNINFTTLPQGLQVLYLPDNQLTGTPNFVALPQGLQELALGANQFTGTPNLATLPQGLRGLTLNVNLLTGTPNLATLPQGLQQLYLQNNKLTGTPNLASLPQGLKILNLEFNQFTGSGTFPPNQGWCITGQHDMCGAHDGAFQCSSGVWNCTN